MNPRSRSDLVGVKGRIQSTLNDWRIASATIGESWKDAVCPEVVAEYQTRGFTYLKFVVDKLEDFKEVDAATAEYRDAGFKGPVFVMPVGGTDAAYFANSKHIADIALEKGYRYSPRLHVDIWSNGWGK
jgi:organic radical activating enzyme